MEDDSKRSKGVAKRLATLPLILAGDQFPKPSIESIGQKTADRLSELRRIHGKKVLRSKPKGDVLIRIYENYLFLRDDVFPIVERLMQRTSNAITFDKNYMLGCYFLSSEDGGEDKVELVIDDDLDNVDGRVSTPDSVQELWDKSTILARKALRKFSTKSKHDLLKYFEEYADEYKD